MTSLKKENRSLKEKICELTEIIKKLEIENKELKMYKKR